MNRRFVVVASAALIAGLVLAASVILGPPILRSEPIDPGDDLNPATSDSASDVTYTILQRGETDDDITRTVLRADRLQRLDRGVSRLTRPRAEMRYSPTRAMTLSADSADVIMVDNQPQRGTFTGNVVITLYEAAPGQSLVLDPTNPRHQQFIRLRIFLDDQTNFDLATNDIDTAGPVHVTARETDFFGQGLRLKYNSRRKRIEQLVITHGRYLMYNPEAKTATLEGEGEEDPQVQPADPADPNTPVPPSQYYLATFRDQVLVREGNRSELFGDTQLDLRFSFGQEAITPPSPIAPNEEPDNTTGQLLPPIPGWQLAQATDNTTTDTPAQILPTPGDENTPEAQPESGEGPDDSVTPPEPLPAQPVTIPAINLARSMFDHDPDRDVVVTWSGQLRLTPLSSKPDTLVDDKDVHFSLQGPNAYAQTTRDDRTDRIEAGEIEYILATQLVKAIAPEGGPIRIVSSTIGSLEGSALSLDQQAGTGTILGPGSITQLPDDEGKSLNLTWTDKLELQLYTEQIKAKQAEAADESSPVPAREGQVRITGLRSARFLGSVTALHPDFDLSADELTLNFHEPDDAANRKNDPFRISAAGDVVVHARGDAEDERFAIAAQSLTVNLETDIRGELYASSMRALVDVTIERPGNMLTCRRVDVAMAPPAPPAPPEAPEAPDALALGNAAQADAPSQPDNKPYAKVRSLIAQGTVRAELDYDGRRVDLSADQLVADVELDQLTLIANNDRNLAEVYDVDDDRKLSGKLIVMDDQAEQVRVDGPGVLAAGLDDPDLAASRLAVAWQRAMTFDNIQSTAHFEGKVNATTLRSTDQTELSADTLDLRFSPDPDHDPRNLLLGGPETGNDNNDQQQGGALAGGGGREVRSTVATGNVVFIAAAFETNQPGKPYNRVRIEGPKLTFTNRPRTSPTAAPVETLQVDGKGIMLIEDYRKREPADEDPAADATRVAVTGRGATAFTWDDRMSLDARTNTATFVDTVQMIHRPRNDDDTNGQVVELYAQTLIADMQDGGGLGVWLSDNAPDAQITTVHADDSVRLVRDGRELRGDHLKYTAADQLAELWADGENKVIVHDRATDNTATARRALWDLAKDRIELQGTSGGAAGG